jgi:hypothetical protein
VLAATEELVIVQLCFALEAEVFVQRERGRVVGVDPGLSFVMAPRAADRQSL